ncbi:glycosyltransferase family 2 protein [Yoonia sp. BS5-3]|uniref:Glycosyltransferase family 2 protein n=1 Tax=Yoonia phaeophyticola TaxID=3137369 RepID=A0ABZ2V8N4_9RHOB
MSILVFIPMYNCAQQIPRVLDQLRDPRIAKLIDGVVCVDNRSTDGTAEAAEAALADLPLPSRTLLRNDDNYGLGGSHKVAINFARDNGFTHLIVLHGDDQGSIIDIAAHLENGTYENCDFLMGARFMRGSQLQGYSALRTIANRVFNMIFSVVSGKRLYDLGSGLNLFRVSAFQDDFHLKFADDLTFNYYLILGVVAYKHRVTFFPLTWREDDQISNAKLSKMGFQILRLLGARIMSKRKFLQSDHRAVARGSYPSTQIGHWTE